MYWLSNVLKPRIREKELIMKCTRSFSSQENLTINNRMYEKDSMTNITPRILSHMDRQLHMQPHHPLCLIKQNIANYMYKMYRGHRGIPSFSVHDQLSPVVSLHQNFDSLLVPCDHVSRNKSDSYYINKEYMLRAHTSAHQTDLIQMGLDNFLVVGDVYRRDEIDSSHYPVFHQMEGVRLMSGKEVAKMSSNKEDDIKFFENGERTDYKQGVHSTDVAKLLELDLKQCLGGLANHLFGKEVEVRWVECYFPFTHPSWELEVKYQGEWLEVLGCGVIEQEILTNAGVQDKAGWAFGLGLERLAMVLYQIPDIRLFWTRDTGFLSQFESAEPETVLKYRTTSKYPQCRNDISFWLGDKSFSPNDFYDLVRDVGGDLVEQVKLLDQFHHPKKKMDSQTYSIVYRDMTKTLTQEEANQIHSRIEQTCSRLLGVTIR